jgi:prevent-host-death family protein
MTTRIPVSQFKTHCLRLVEEVAQQHKEFVVTKRGKPVVRLVPTGEADPNEPFARLRGTLVGGEHVADFDTGMTSDAARRR